MTDYLLTVLTNGRRVCLERTIASLAAHLDPAPARVFVMDDAGATGYGFVASIFDSLGWSFAYEDAPRPLGQCAAMAHCMHAAAASPLEWVLAWEDDVVLLRPLRLDDLRRVMEYEENVAQMGLVRAAVGAEVEYGGFIPQSPGWYERRLTPWPEQSLEWIATTRNWQCAQALFPTECAREFPYPAEPGCETDYGPMIRATYPDAVFGLYGGGEAWTSHVGVERAAGSHGY